MTYTVFILTALQISALIGTIVALGMNAILYPKATFQLLTFKGGDAVDKIGGFVIWLFIIFGLSIFF